ncbi:UPF0149 family protein [Marivita geojedonensis]|uniref:YecA family protein n=1 Tax=Marivita geojedonensis TaxID=1123756 RepID=A0A1X4N6K1_9RHOB|nr:UPF0149 family protein [Marivita geojedonensis]OSQ41871.1 hypothetical protein MGEO_20905 [Marivita geojedonensis]PRY67773.1 uncharacterized protein CLV76_1662 [Marivita geojedonensis]
MLNDDELDQLESLLLFHTDEDGMLLSEFDGFCAGLIVCPEVIMPGEWLPCVWGSRTSHLDTLEDVQDLTDLLMRHYNDVVQSLMPPALEYGPIYDQDNQTAEVLWETWCCGFERAMALRPDSWEQIVEGGDEEAAAAVNMMLALYHIAEGQSDLSKASIKTLTKDAPDIIPNLVLTLNTWTKSGTTAAPFPAWAAANQPQAPFHGTKVGRNDPCPCGSGRKYKRCCGSN